MLQHERHQMRAPAPVRPYRANDPELSQGPEDEDASKLKFDEGGGTRHQCPSCGKDFRRVYDLNRHAKLHTGVKPHVCPRCNKKFSRGDALIRHMRPLGSCAQRYSIDHGRDVAAETAPPQNQAVRFQGPLGATSGSGPGPEPHQQQQAHLTQRLSSPVTSTLSRTPTLSDGRGPVPAPPFLAAGYPRPVQPVSGGVTLPSNLRPEDIVSLISRVHSLEHKVEQLERYLAIEQVSPSPREDVESADGTRPGPLRTDVATNKPQ